MTVPNPLHSRLARAALLYARLGWPVFPCLPGTKLPATRHGFYDATTDPALIAAWWDSCPECNIGIATGAPGPDVLDVDVKPDGDGYAALRRLANAGLLAGAFLLVGTRNGGRHLYYPGTGQGCHSLPGHHLDLKACGGYVIAPPSVVPADDFALAGGRPVGAYRLLAHRRLADGRPFAWSKAVALIAPPAPARPRVVRGNVGAADPGRALAGLVRKVATAPEGERNQILFWAACRAAEHAAAGRFDPTQAHTALSEAAGQAGLGAIEITRTLRSAMGEDSVG